MIVIDACLLFVTNSIIFYGYLRGGGGCCCGGGRFISISSVICQVGQGNTKLTSVYILLAVILIVVSSATYLCFNTRSTITTQYPGDVGLAFAFSGFRNVRDRGLRGVERAVQGCDKSSTSLVNIETYRIRKFFARGNVRVSVLAGKLCSFSASGINCLSTVSLSSCGGLVGGDRALSTSRYLVCSGHLGGASSAFAMRRNGAFGIGRRLGSFGISNRSLTVATPIICLIIDSLRSFTVPFGRLGGDSSSPVVACSFEYNFSAAGATSRRGVMTKLRRSIISLTAGSRGKLCMRCDGVFDHARGHSGFCSVCKDLFFLKVVLDVMFLVTTILVVCCGRVYRKCRSRTEFSVVRGINVAGDSVGGDVGSRVLAMFFLPLTFTNLRLNFTFPFITGVLLVFTFDGAGLDVLMGVNYFTTFNVLCTIACGVASNTCCTVMDKEGGSWVGGLVGGVLDGVILCVSVILVTVFTVPLYLYLLPVVSV